MLGWLRKRKSRSKYTGHLAPLVTFGKYDKITVGDAFEGICIFGGIGSGKTSGSGFTICSSMLGYGFGGLVLTTKPDEVDRWRRLCHQFGRSEDLIIFDADHDSQFNFLDYQLSCQATPLGMTENLVNLIEEMMEVSSRASGMQSNKGDEQYWANSRRSLMRNAISLIIYATGQIGVSHILEVIRDAPRDYNTARSEQWRQDSLICSMLALARARYSSDALVLHDLQGIEHYFLSTFANLSDRTRSVVESSVQAMLELFTSGVLYRLYGRGTNITPKACRQGKIIVINQPIKRDHAIGLIGQTIWKSQFQQTMELDSGRDVLPCFLCIDEAQNFLTLRDMHFAATARSSRCINLWLTQNINNVYASMGSDEAGKAAANSLLGLAQTKIFHQNSDTDTNLYAAELFGKRKMLLSSTSLQQPQREPFQWFQQEPICTTSMSESLDYVVPPYYMTSLLKGGLPHRKTQAYVYCGGRTWRDSQDTFLFTNFKQGF